MDALLNFIAIHKMKNGINEFPNDEWFRNEIYIRKRTQKQKEPKKWKNKEKNIKENKNKNKILNK